ncbi:MAG: DUF488 domain-containing protein [Kiloniellales bacterium]|nr:DUF488 domain-containing protein [Kiloniellales bacterium]
MEVYTIGHSTRSQDELIALLKEAGVAFLVDVRSYPRSRTNPQFNADVLAAALERAGIGYRHMKALGGRRGAQDLGRPSPNALWRHEAFRNYADYALTPAFAAAIGELRALARERRTAIMCAEALWWQCHRRIVADYLLAAGDQVRHILGPGKIEPASLTPGAEPQAEGTLHYPAEQGELF